MNDITLSLMVLRCHDIDVSRAFYEQLGLSFTQESHGQGPLHYVATINRLVIELYPQNSDDQQGKENSDPIRIGFTIGFLDNVIQSIQEKGNKIHSMPRQTQWGYRAVIIDPDGRKVELAERP